MVRPLRKGRAQGLAQSSRAILPNPEGNTGAESTTQSRVRIQESDAKLPNPRDNLSGKAQEHRQTRVRSQEIDPRENPKLK